MENEKYKKIFVSLIFLIFLLVGLFIFTDYGVSWDEPRQREIGTTIFNQVFQGNTTSLPIEDRYYGPVFELSLVLLEKVFNFKDLRDIFLMRHLLNFLVFYMGLWFFYLLCKNYFKNWKIGLLGVLFLILSPRIFADAFYNSKDLIFMSIFIISVYTLIRFLDKPSFINACLHGLSCGILIDLRVLGIFLPFLTFLFFTFEILKIRENKEKTFKMKKILIIYIIALAAVTLFLWPALWENPIDAFIQALKVMSNYPWEGTLLYLGNYISSTNLPWYYIPSWIVITTPLLYIFGFFMGLFASLMVLIKQKLKIYDEVIRNNLLVILWFFLPIITIILIKSTLYDGWRQMFFVYPALIIVAIEGFIFLFYIINSFTKFKKVIMAFFLIIVLVSTINTLLFMILNHPNQNVYFNVFAGKSENIKSNFEMDYWGLSYKQGLEYLLKIDNRSEIKLVVENLPGVYNSYILKSEDRARLKYQTRLNETDYFITNYRWHKEDYPYPEIYTVNLSRIKILAVYKINSNV